MDNTSDKVKINIVIAGESIPLTVDAERQSAVRLTQREVNDLFDTWHRRFPQKTDKELLAMVAYQFASFYRDLRDRYDMARDLALQLELRLDTLIPPKEPDNTDDRKSPDISIYPDV